MSLFANRSSRHAARLGPALRVTPPHWLCRTPNRHQGEQTMRAGSPFKLALCLAIAIPFALAACGGGGGEASKPTARTMPTPPETPAPPETPKPGAEMEQAPTPNEWPVRTQAEFDRVATDGAEKMAEGVSKIAENEPNFGSVIQTSEPRVVGEVEHTGRGFIHRS